MTHTAGNIFILTALVILQTSILAQQRVNKCASWDILTPEQRRYLDIEVEAAIAPIVKNILKTYFTTGARQVPDIIRIPVVFNVVYRTAAENVPDWQLLAQIDTLNKMYRLKNLPYANLPPYFASVAADTRIEFCLARRDPLGNPTTGIRRRQTTVNCFNHPDERSFATGGIDPWDPNRYLNIWVANMCGGVLGIATFPYTNNTPLGVTIHYTSLPGGSPPYDQGKTAVHEVGHFLGLRHIWGDNCNLFGCNCGDDKVGDTPPQSGPTYGCPAFPAAACGGYQSKMFVNHMDYSDDACLHMFTQGQAARMWAFLKTVPYLRSLTKSPVCALYTDDAGIAEIISPGPHLCSNTFAPQVVLKNYGTSNLTSVDIVVAVNGVIQYTFNWTGNLAPDAETTITLPNIIVGFNNTYVLQVWTQNPNGNPDPFPLNDTAGTEFSSPWRCPFSSDFELTGVRDSLPGPIWDILNPDLETSANQVSNNSPARTWVRLIPQEVTGSNGAPTYAAFMDLYWYPPVGERDYFISPVFDLTGVGPTITLQFDVAYCRYDNTTNDSLIVEISTDCGATWTRIWADGGPTLATCPGGQLSTGVYLPNAANEWRTVTLNLDAYAGQKIMLRFSSYNAFGNSLFVDNISLNFTPASCNPLSIRQIDLNAFYNPKTNSVQLKISANPEILNSFNSLRILKHSPDKNSVWKIIARFDQPSNYPITYTDPDIEPGSSYTYRLEGKSAQYNHWQLLDVAHILIYPATKPADKPALAVRKDNNSSIIAYVSNLPSEAKLILENATGKKLYEVNISPPANNYYRLPAPPYAGFYLIRLTDMSGNTLDVKKITIEN